MSPVWHGAGPGVPFTCGVAVVTRFINHVLWCSGAALLATTPLAAQTTRSMPLKHTPAPTAPAVTPEDLMTRLYIFADDSMQGRANGTAGHFRGTEYIAQELTRLGLEPAGENGTFFQNVPLMRETPTLNATLGDATLTIGPDALLLPGGFGLPFGGSLHGNVPVVFGGTFGAADALPPAATAGKLVVFRPPVGPNGQPALGFWAHPAFGEYTEVVGGFAVVAMELLPPQAVALLQNATTVYSPPNRDIGPFGMVVSETGAHTLMGRPLAEVTPGDTGRTLMGVAQYSLSDLEAPTRNVVALLPGSDPVLRSQYVGIGAHSDHDGILGAVVDHDSLRAFNTVVRPRGAEDGGKQATASDWPKVRLLLDSLRALRAGRRDSIMNGADDDGSGSMAVLEVAEAFATAETKPRRSLLFVWHAAEELGLFGSQHYSDFPTVPRDSIVAMVNVDMIGRGGPADLEDGGPGYVQLIGSRRLSTELGDLVEHRNVDGEHGLRFDYTFDANNHPDQYYCRSDHYNYARYGIPVVFASTGGHRDYHQPTDEPQYLDYQGMARVTNFLQDLMASVANLDHRPVVDKPKPDPHGECVQ